MTKRVPTNTKKLAAEIQRLGIDVTKIEGHDYDSKYRTGRFFPGTKTEHGSYAGFCKHKTIHRSDPTHMTCSDCYAVNAAYQKFSKIRRELMDQAHDRRGEPRSRYGGQVGRPPGANKATGRNSYVQMQVLAALTYNHPEEAAAWKEHFLSLVPDGS